MFAANVGGRKMRVGLAADASQKTNICCEHSVMLRWGGCGWEMYASAMVAGGYGISRRTPTIMEVIGLCGMRPVIVAEPWFGRRTPTAHVADFAIVKRACPVLSGPIVAA